MKVRPHKKLYDASLTTQVSVKHLLTRTIPLLLIFASSFIVIGWVDPELQILEIDPGFTSIKFTTAFIFLFIGCMQLTTGRWLENMNSMLFMLISIVGLTSVFTYDTLTIIPEFTPNQKYTISAGVPSIGTVLAFFVFSISIYSKKLRLGSIMLFGMAGIALIGNILKWPLLFYYVEGVSTGMSVITALMFILCGLWLRFVRIIPTMTLERLFELKDVPFIIAEFNMNEYKFTSMSDSSYKILGYRPDEMINKPFMLFSKTEDIAAAVEEVKKNTKQGTAAKGFRNTYIHKNGSEVPLIWFTDGVLNSKAISIGIPEEYI